MTLVDTSAWIEHFRARGKGGLERWVPFDDVVTCLPVIQEVLPAFKDDVAYRRAAEAMFSLPIVESPIGAGVYRDAVGLYRAARRSELIIRTSTDCLIAACALRNDLEVLHRDRDFPQLAKVSALRQRDLAR